MKLSCLLIPSLSLIMMANGFVVVPRVQQQPRSLVRSSLTEESDFASAMPPKPEITLDEKMEQSATQFIATFSERLADGVEPPPELEALQKARDDGASPQEMAKAMYELMIEQGMLYDKDPETGIMTPTEWDIKENLDALEVKKEFLYLYQYGMNLIARGLLEIDEVKSIVKDRLIERTGKTPEEFDEWLGY